MATKPKKNTAPVVETPVVEVAAAAEAAPATRTRGPRGVSEDAVITLLAETNPKRAGSKAAEAFANYKSGMTVAEFADAVGKDATGHLVYDAKHGFISIDGYNPGEIIAPKVREPKAPKEPKAPRAKKAKADPAADAAVEAVAEEEVID